MTSHDLLRLSRARQYAASGRGEQIRTAAHVSRRQLAITIGVPTSTVSRWEQRKTQPRGAAAIRWVDMLDQLDANAVQEVA